MTIVAPDQGVLRRWEGPLPPGLSGEPAMRDYFGNSRRAEPGAQAYLVDPYPANSETRAHFHTVDQFQVFVPGEGSWYQRHPIDGMLLHFADAYVTYGPFGSGDEPMSLYTLRRRASELTGFMPKDRDKLKATSRRRNIHVGLEPLPQPPAEPGTRTERELIAAHDDGLQATLTVAGPSTELPVAPLGTGCGGLYSLVLRGQLVYRGEAFGRDSLGWWEPPAEVTGLATGPDAGVVLLTMRFPAAP